MSLDRMTKKCPKCQRIYYNSKRKECPICKRQLKGYLRPLLANSLKGFKR